MGWFEDAVNTAANVAVQSATYGTVGFNDGKFGAGVVTNALTGGAGKDGVENQYALPGADGAARQKDMDAGYKKGREIFYDDPDMQDLRTKNEDLAKGYDGETLGALKGQANAEAQGNRAGQLRDLEGKAARGGIGGARAAGIVGAANKKSQDSYNEMQRKMTIDNADQVSKGTKGLQDFIMGQKYGELGTGLGYAQLGVTDRSADAQAQAANRKENKGVIGQLLSPLEGLF